MLVIVILRYPRLKSLKFDLIFSKEVISNSNPKRTDSILVLLPLSFVCQYALLNDYVMNDWEKIEFIAYYAVIFIFFCTFCRYCLVSFSTLSGLCLYIIPLCHFCWISCPCFFESLVSWEARPSFSLCAIRNNLLSVLILIPF